MRSALALLPALFALACGPSQPANNQQGYNQNGQYPQQQGQYPQQQGQYPQQQGQYPQQQGQYPQQQQQYPQQQGTTPQQGTPPAQGGLAIPGLPSSQPAAGGAQGGTATALDPNLAGAAGAGLAALAATNAPGAAAEGGVIAGNFQAGQTIEQAFTIQPGKCYTVIGSSVGIQQLDAAIIGVTPIPGMSPNFGSATGKPGVGGSQVVLGPKTNCVKLALSPIPVQAKFVVTATKGAGMAAAQLYVK